MNNTRRQGHRYSYRQAVTSSGMDRESNAEQAQQANTAVCTSDNKQEQQVDATRKTNSTSDNNKIKNNNNKETTKLSPGSGQDADDTTKRPHARA